MSENKPVSPRNSTSKTRNAILRIKNSSPRLQTVLRQKYRERIQNDRSEILAKLRGVTKPEAARNILSNILREEMLNIDSKTNRNALNKFTLSSKFEGINLDEELHLEDVLEQELLAQYENWLLEEYEYLMDEISSNVVICPLCCLGPFKMEDRQIKCNKCFNAFSANKTLETLHKDIFHCLEVHNRNCSLDPKFTVVPENGFENSLCIMCHSCSFLSVVL